MIRIFRKIRHQLLSEDRYSIYILYASGEILLVVIGILIALQLDNWNDNRKQELAGEVLSSRLYQELLNIREYNVRWLEVSQWQYNIIDRILEQGTRLDVDSLMAATQDYWAIQKFSLTTYAFAFTEFYDPDVKLYKSSVADGSWDPNTEKASLEAILDDGTFRFILQKKLDLLKSKLSIVEGDITVSVEEAIEIYER